MATINLKQVGAYIKVERAGFADTYKSIYSPNNQINFHDDTGKISVTLGDLYHLADSLSEVLFSGVAATNEADFEAKVAAVFPKANTGSGGSGASTFADLTGDPYGNTALAADLNSKQDAPALVTNAATTLTLSTGGIYVFTGTNATWTLPAGTAKLTFTLFHRGTGTLTVNGTMFGQAAVSSITLLTGDSRTLTYDGTYYLIN